MYARHSAWLWSVPEKRKKTRLEYYEEQGSELVNLPDVAGFEYLLNALFDCGPVKSAFQGAEAIGYVDIAAYVESTGADLSGNDCRLIRKLSRAYADQMVDSRSANCPPPYVVAVATPEARQKVDDGFRALAARRRKR